MDRQESRGTQFEMEQAVKTCALRYIHSPLPRLPLAHAISGLLYNLPNQLTLRVAGG